MTMAVTEQSLAIFNGKGEDVLRIMHINKWKDEQLMRLILEMESGDSTLVRNGSFLVRVVDAVTVRVNTQHEGTPLTLMGEQPLMHDYFFSLYGENGIGAGVSVAVRPGEDVTSAARRAISSELGINEPRLPLLPCEPIKRVVGPVESQLFPGLQSRYRICASYCFTVLPHSYHAAGYWNHPNSYSWKALPS